MTKSRYVFFAKNGTSLPAVGREADADDEAHAPYSGVERVAPSRTMAAISSAE